MSTTWRSVSAKVSSICCRCNRRDAHVASMQTRRVLESLCYWQFRECEQTFHEQLTVTPSREPPFAPPFLGPPFAPVSRSPSAPLFDTSTFPRNYADGGKSLEPCLIVFAASRRCAEIFRLGSRGRVSPYKYQFAPLQPIFKRSRVYEI